ncbi:ROK family transcriptional regulator [Martelella endophytica]|uniref:ROK family transcriptional regulator n=1 Tax=Martelella endophytica TaxID=1486262 RepID=A0A0D5LRS3_MAREN|nr:ROK family transcriptional regulator [Martelella endophytica]AJY46053.1 ROK family transcriptional regulator [Martelella endophytica]
MKLTGANGGQAAQRNRAMILAAIHRDGPVSRSELAEKSRLTKQAVTRIVERLIDDGLIMEARRRHGLRGQPAIELEINPDGLSSIGVHIDRSHLTILAVNGTGQVLAREHHEEPFMMPDMAMKYLKETFRDFLRRGAINKERLAGIGIAIPDWLGEIGVIGIPEAYGAWTRFDMRAAIADFADDPVYIDNDANAAALGEVEYGLGTEMRTFFYILVNACLGGALVIDGRLHKGASGLGGEIGWVPLALEDGSAETRPIGDMFSLIILQDILAREGIAIEKPADLLMLDERGKQIVSAWLARFAVKLAEAIINVGMIVDPDGVVIGGRLPARLIDELLLYVHDEITKRGVTAPSLHRAAGSADAVARGAAAMPLAHAMSLPSAESAQRVRMPLTNALRRAPA